LKIRSLWVTRLLANLFSLAVWLVFRTLRMEFREEVPGTNPYGLTSLERYLYCVWHDSMVIPAFGGKHRSTAALTSQHADGSFVAQVLRFVGVSTIRGSTNHMGTGALRRLMRTTEDKHIVITPDGPRGPRRQMSVGIAFLASRTGRAIVPTAYHCERCWRFAGSWTDLVIPKPFSRVYFLAGEPIYLPPELGTDELRAYVTKVQAAMDRLDELAESLANPSLGDPALGDSAPMQRDDRMAA